MFIAPDLKQVLNYPSLRRGLLCEDTLREVRRGVACKFRAYVSRRISSATRSRGGYEAPPRARNLKSSGYRWFYRTRKVRRSRTETVVQAQLVATLSARVNFERSVDRKICHVELALWCIARAEGNSIQNENAPTLRSRNDGKSQYKHELAPPPAILHDAWRVLITRYTTNREHRATGDISPRVRAHISRGKLQRNKTFLRPCCDIQLMKINLAEARQESCVNFMMR